MRRVGILLTSLTLATFLCLSQARTWISNVICNCLLLCSMIWCQKWLFVLLILVLILDHHSLNLLFTIDLESHFFLQIIIFFFKLIMFYLHGSIILL
jgi:hypothetical protein